MKTLLKPVAALLIAGCSFVAVPNFASAKSPLFNRFAKTGVAVKAESFSVTIHKLGNSEIIRLFIDKAETKRLYVSLKDAEGNSISNFLTEKGTGRFSKDYNFDQADEGLYTLEISDGKSKIIKKIKLERVRVKEVTNLSVE
ncbi:MAG: hypothetical protein JST87_01820 [Bacteroidetes bacterium]|nr:hypothetical protein [Bacteroidota bacterium]MBS1933291.1 hypothetical protein [Bacteroidota bacterium]